jgi:hypothetical protein
VICEGDFVFALTLFDFSWSTASMNPPARDVAEHPPISMAINGFSWICREMDLCT